MIALLNILLSIKQKSDIIFNSVAVHMAHNWAADMARDIYKTNAMPVFDLILYAKFLLLLLIKKKSDVFFLLM